jgi:hypothetical protein
VPISVDRKLPSSPLPRPMSLSSSSSFPFYKNRLDVDLYRSTSGPLSISIYSKNVCLSHSTSNSHKLNPKQYQTLKASISIKTLTPKLTPQLYTTTLPLIWECKDICREVTMQAQPKKNRLFSVCGWFVSCRGLSKPR